MDVKKLLLLSLVFVFPALASAEEGFDFPVAASSKVLGYGPLWVAAGKGFLKREGLNSEVTAMRGTAPAMQALVSDSIYVALAAHDGPIGLVYKGAEIEIIDSDSRT